MAAAPQVISQLPVPNRTTLLRSLSKLSPREPARDKSVIQFVDEMLTGFPQQIIPPTSDPHVAGALWNNGGVPTISTG